MASPQFKSMCIVHVESQLDSPKCSFREDRVEIEVPSAAGALAGKQGDRETVLFDRVFRPGTPQDVIFAELAKDDVLACVEKSVSSVFLAFGPTACGKTFAITGGAKHFKDRGLIPRAISQVFEALAGKKSREDFEVAVSFYELYKDSVIDLLSEGRRKVAVKSSERGPLLVGLLRQVVQAESDAYQLLFHGDSNRHFERLPLNPETSRGHVFFVLYVSNLISGSIASLAFVDLAAASGPRNQATNYIAATLDDLRGSVQAMADGTEVPEKTVLCQLLKPSIKPYPGLVMPSVTLVAPLRFSLAAHSEVLEWMRFARLVQDCLRRRSASPPLQKAWENNSNTPLTRHRKETEASSTPGALSLPVTPEKVPATRGTPASGGLQISDAVLGKSAPPVLPLCLHAAPTVKHVDIPVSPLQGFATAAPKAALPLRLGNTPVAMAQTPPPPPPSRSPPRQAVRIFGPAGISSCRSCSTACLDTVRTPSPAAAAQLYAECQPPRLPSGAIAGSLREPSIAAPSFVRSLSPARLAVSRCQSPAALAPQCVSSFASAPVLVRPPLFLQQQGPAERMASLSPAPSIARRAPVLGTASPSSPCVPNPRATQSKELSPAVAPAAFVHFPLCASLSSLGHPQIAAAFAGWPSGYTARPLPAPVPQSAFQPSGRTVAESGKLVPPSVLPKSGLEIRAQAWVTGGQAMPWGFGSRPGPVYPAHLSAHIPSSGSPSAGQTMAKSAPYAAQ